MVKNAELLEKYKKKALKKDKVNIKKNYKILEALYKEAKQIKKFNAKDTSNVVYKIAKIVNRV